MRPVSVLVVGLLTSILTLVAPPGTPSASAATGSCQTVSGALAATGGPQRATVVVDTGSGAVWSACISFSGTISGVDALELAKAQIPGLSPVYDLYAGEGRAVCRLRGVGNNPPDCLGKTVDYWGYFRNGRYSSAGAGAVTVRDGDIEAWRWGTSGATPRRATDGYQAAPSVAPPPTAAPTTRPPAAPTTVAPRPPSGSSAAPAPGAASSAEPPRPAGEVPATSTVPAGAVAPTTSTSSTTTSAVSDPTADAKPQAATGQDVDGDAAVRSTSGDDELAAGTPGAPGGPSLDDADTGSSTGSIAAFAAALAAVGGVGLVLRRRRTAAV